MVELSVDEFNVTFQLVDDVKDWSKQTKRLVRLISDNLQLVEVFGYQHEQPYPMKGYQKAFTYGDHDFYTSINYHEDYVKMGVCLRFSAQAWNFYREQTGLNLWQVLQGCRSELYTFRLTKCDIVADYINEGLNVNVLAEDLKNEHVGVFLTRHIGNGQSLQRTKPHRNAFLCEDKVQTVYLGDRAHGRAFLRIYDKRQEQLSKIGIHYARAQSCDDWVRFELVLRSNYAHSITDEFLSCSSDEEFALLLAGSIISRYAFYELEDGERVGLTPYSQHLICKAGDFRLQAPVKVRDYSLSSSLDKLFRTSGLFACMKKIEEIFGYGARYEFLDYMDEQYINNYKPTSEHLLWLKNNQSIYQNNFKDFEDYVQNDLEPFLLSH